MESSEPAGTVAKLGGNGRVGRFVGLGAFVVALVAGAAWWRLSGRESTDDAQIEGHVYPVAARVGGTVTAVLAKDNEPVEKGATLVRIDPRDYDVALKRALADLAESEASARAAEGGVPLTYVTGGSEEKAAAGDAAAAEARLAAARARVREAQVRDAKATQDLLRLKPLVAKDEVSRQEYDGAVSAADAARASRETAEASVGEAEKALEAAQARLAAAKTAPERVDIQRAKAASEAAKADQSKADVERARLNLEYTEIKAPISGVVSRRSVEVGQVVQAGQPLVAVVPLDDVWVVANFKESQLRHMRPGLPATVSVDGYGGLEFNGHVESIAAATGARFSLLPPENATGNYVKVVQRIPVKIVLEQPADAQHPLRPGMSVVPTVYTR
jgi:membrane fusion protein (multidrug efflux system)